MTCFGISGEAGVDTAVGARGRDFGDAMRGGALAQWGFGFEGIAHFGEFVIEGGLEPLAGVDLFQSGTIAGVHGSGR